MVFQEQTYSVLIVTASDSFTNSIMPLLPMTDYWPVTTVRSVGEARRRIAETSFDIVLINAPLPDDFGMRLAIDICSNSGAGVLLLVKNDHFNDIYAKVVSYSNPATIMTDTSIADKVYMEPLTLEYIAKIIRYERPDAILPGMGGQTRLNLAMQLEKKGILGECRTELLGTRRLPNSGLLFSRFPAIIKLFPGVSRLKSYREVSRMTQKELGELRRRFRPDKNAISRIYGCYVNSNKEVISYLDESIGTMPQEETEKYLSLLKKGLSGSLGRNLIDIVFTTQQVADSGEHRLLRALRDSQLKDAAAREQFYQTVIQSLDMADSNYLILLAHDAYDVPHRGKDDEVQADASDEMFSYIVCCVCPVKDGKLELGFFSGDNEFHSCVANQIVSAPELGFLFPAFDNRAANIYNALFYSRKPDEIHHEFINAVFRTEAPMSAAEQKEAFQAALTGALEDACSMEVVQAVHERLRDKIEQHKESKDPEPLALSAQEIGEILGDSGVEQERVAAFREQCQEQFGGSVALNPENIIDARRFEVKTPDATVNIDPERSYLVETRIIDGRKYILIPADEGVEVNGMAVEIAPGTE